MPNQIEDDDSGEIKQRVFMTEKRKLTHKTAMSVLKK